MPNPLIRPVDLRGHLGRRVMALAAAAGCCAAAAGSLTACSLFQVDCDDYRFDRTAWRTADDGGRADTAEDLARCRVLQGRTKAQVKRMLGRPVRNTHYSLRFSAGMVTGGIGPPELRTLIVGFNRRGRVDEAFISSPTD